MTMKTYNIPIFVPHRGCPFDCVFCNQKRITGTQKEVTADDVHNIIGEYLKTLPSKNRRIEAAFFGGSFTGIPINEQSELLAAANEYLKKGDIDGIRLSTRPDYIDKEILDNLLKYGVTTIELGVQSMDDSVLKSSNRGHTREDVINAVKLIKEYPFTLGLQMYLTGKYQPQSVDEAVNLAKQLLLKFEKNNITVIRVGLQSTDEISENGSVVAGPVHSSFRELVESSIYYDIICGKLKDGCKRADVYVNPREVSKAVGNKRCNIIKF